MKTPVWQALALVSNYLKTRPYGFSETVGQQVQNALLEQLPFLTSATYDHTKGRLVCRGDVDLCSSDGRREYGPGAFTLYVEPNLLHGYRLRVVFDPDVRQLAYRLKYRDLVIDVLMDAFETPAPDDWATNLFSVR